MQCITKKTAVGETVWCSQLRICNDKKLQFFSVVTSSDKYQWKVASLLKLLKLTQIWFGNPLGFGNIIKNYKNKLNHWRSIPIITYNHAQMRKIYFRKYVSPQIFFQMLADGLTSGEAATFSSSTRRRSFTSNWHSNVFKLRHYTLYSIFFPNWK